ncbi:MAG: phage holin family protein [Clostridia bacterium]|nr:phage holin family protein [Clostridia bacterium]
MRDERELLTRQTIQRKLEREAKHSIVGTVLILFLGLVVLGVMFLLLAAVAPMISTVTVAVETVLVAIFVLVCILFMIRGASRLSRARKETFSVIEDELGEVCENHLNLWRLLLTGRLFDRSCYEHVFEFKSGKKYVVNCSENQNTSLDAVAKFSLPGDKFYLVFYTDSPEKVVLLYASKLYRYQA